MRGQPIGSSASALRWIEVSAVSRAFARPSHEVCATVHELHDRGADRVGGGGTHEGCLLVGLVGLAEAAGLDAEGLEGRLDEAHGAGAPDGLGAAVVAHRQGAGYAGADQAEQARAQRLERVLA